MKNTALFLLCLFAHSALSTGVEKSPLEVVNARMAAYNNHDIDAFLDTYSEEIQIFTYPDTPLGKKGKDHIAYIFTPMFEEAAVSVKIVSQIAQGNYVINDETVTYDGKAKKYVSIYEVVDGKIVSVRFVRE